LPKHLRYTSEAVVQNCLGVITPGKQWRSISLFGSFLLF
jgi:hypothetical protein